MIDRRGPAQEIGMALLAHSDAMFDWRQRVRDDTLRRSIFQTYLGWLRAAFVEDPERALACGCSKTAAPLMPRQCIN